MSVRSVAIKLSLIHRKRWAALKWWMSYRFTAAYGQCLFMLHLTMVLKKGEGSWINLWGKELQVTVALTFLPAGRKRHYTVSVVLLLSVSQSWTCEWIMHGKTHIALHFFFWSIAWLFLVYSCCSLIFITLLFLQMEYLLIYCTSTSIHFTLSATMLFVFVLYLHYCCRICIH